jgi:hypothetical protein
MNTKRNLIRVLLVLTIGATAAIASPSFAAPHHASKAATGYTLTIPDASYTGATTATLTGAPMPYWAVVMTCYQNGLTVMFYRVGLDPNGQITIPLGPTSNWTSGIGGADCPTEAKYWNMQHQKWIHLASTTFHVSD